MNTKISENGKAAQIEEWLTNNVIGSFTSFNAIITQQTCELNKDTYRSNLKDECVPKELLEKVEYCVFKCSGLTKN